MNEFYQEILALLKDNSLSKEDAQKKKHELCKKHHIAEVPSDIQILLQGKERPNLVTKPVRSTSGVSVIALMTAPFNCPHGKCTFCPGGLNSPFGDVPQSYTGNEPSTMRGIRNFYDPYLIAFNRLEQYIATGHLPQKIEAIIMGGTFPAMPKQYQEDFITFTFKAMNDFGELFLKNGIAFEKYKEFFEMPGEFSNAERVKRIQQRVLELKGKSSLEAEQLRNEKSPVRCVALCIETKPDWCFEEHINAMLRFGTTRVELGVQCLTEEVLKKTNRGHTLADTVKATQLMKDSLLKVGYHMMPGLPGQTKEQDVDMFRELFENADFMPDALKIYPTTVIRGTGIYQQWKKGVYTPHTVEDIAECIISAKKHVPSWCRIMRVQRDIPSTVIDAGPNMTNIRQLISEKMNKRGLKCRCIRCREPKNRHVDWDSIKIVEQEYEASGGKEFFISAEDTKNDILLGFCRLRFPSRPFRPEITPESAGVRELHVYGTATPFGETGSVQHKGLGAKMLLRAEEIAKSNEKKKMLIIAGIGTREYYRKFGYETEGVYVSKRL